jgi:hypothetical protein
MREVFDAVSAIVENSISAAVTMFDESSYTEASPETAPSSSDSSSMNEYEDTSDRLLGSRKVSDDA